VSDLTGRVVAHRYQVKRLIGEGAMGSVYLAHKLQSPNTVCALKVLKRELTYDPKFGRRFTDEARSLAKLAHPGVVEIHEFFRDGEDYYIALAYVDGMSLADMIERGGAMDERKALPIFKAILSALDHGHQRGIIHRDVKPSNVLIDKTDRPLLCDFGIAKQVAERGVTATGMTLGTPEYMSPEQIQTPQALDHRSDVYSAGVVLFEMLTGRVPFAGDSTDADLAIRRHHVGTEPPDPRSFNRAIDPELARIVLKALRKDRSRRYQGCAAFQDAIEGYEQAASGNGAGKAGPTPSEDRRSGGPREYRVYQHRILGVAAVKKGFCWPALWANIAWMVRQRLYPHAILWLAAYVGLLIVVGIAAGPLAGAEDLLAIAALCVLLILWLVPGVRGNGWREAELARRGFVLMGTFPARAADEAIARARGR
jgi:serine/threonine protein kinase